MEYNFNEGYFVLNKMGDLPCTNKYRGYSSSLFVYNNKIYLVNCSNDPANGIRYRYDDDIKTWSTQLPLLYYNNKLVKISKRLEHNFIIDNKTFFIADDNCLYMLISENECMKVFDLLNDTNKNTNISLADKYIIIKNEIHFFSGSLQHNVLYITFDNENININIERRKDLLFPMRELTNLVSLNDTIYIVGCNTNGYNLDGDPSHDAFGTYKYNEINDEWIKLNDLYTNKGIPGKCVVFKNKIYLFGYVFSDYNIYELDENCSITNIYNFDELKDGTFNNGLVDCVNNNIHIFTNDFISHYIMSYIDLDIKVITDNETIIFKGYDKIINICIHSSSNDLKNLKIILNSENNTIFDISNDFNNFNENLILNNNIIKDIVAGEYDLIFKIDDKQYKTCKLIKNDVFDLNVENTSIHIDNRDIAFKGENIKCQIFNDISNNDKFNINVNFIESS